MTGSLVESMYSRSFCRLLFSENKSAIFSYVIRSRFDTICQEKSMASTLHTKIDVNNYKSTCCNNGQYAEPPTHMQCSYHVHGIMQVPSIIFLHSLC